MIYDNNKGKYGLEQLEKCINLEQTTNTPSNMKANIVKIMPLIPKGKPSNSIKKEVVVDSIYINDSPCKPTSAKTVTTQNFVTLNPHPNREVLYKSKPSVVEPLDFFTCEVIHGNLRQIYLTDKEY